MDIPQGQPVPRLLQLFRLRPAFHFLSAACAFACLILLANCASPGEPIERKPPVPQPVSDLAAQQVGNTVALTFALPQEDADRRSLTQPLTVEIFRDFQRPPVPGAARNAASPPPLPAPTTLLVTIPPATASNYVMQGLFHYDDELRPDDFSQHPNAVAVYAVRTRASARKESANSNVVSLRLYPLPEPISDLKTEVTHTGIQLTWTAPVKTPVGPVPPILSYRIYRAPAERPPAAAQSAAPPTGAQSPSSQSAALLPAVALVKIAETQSPSYLDSQIQFGNSYVYSVRSVVEVGGQQLESSVSNRAAVLARDIFPPAAPQGLVVVYVPSQPGEPAHLELSWNISVETDLAGYNVYRSEQSGVQGARLNSEPLPSPAFQDSSAVPGRTYFYSVTAVDRSGNESPASPLVSGALPAESQSAP